MDLQARRALKQEPFPSELFATNDVQLSDVRRLPGMVKARQRKP